MDEIGYFADSGLLREAFLFLAGGVLANFKPPLSKGGLEGLYALLSAKGFAFCKDLIWTRLATAQTFGLLRDACLFPAGGILANGSPPFQRGI